MLFEMTDTGHAIAKCVCDCFLSRRGIDMNTSPPILRNSSFLLTARNKMILVITNVQNKKKKKKRLLLKEGPRPERNQNKESRKKTEKRQGEALREKEKKGEKSSAVDVLCARSFKYDQKKSLVSNEIC